MDKNIKQWQQLIKDKGLAEQKAIMEVIRSAVIPGSALK
jgi:hypothetical protein